VCVRNTDVAVTAHRPVRAALIVRNVVYQEVLGSDQLVPCENPYPQERPFRLAGLIFPWHDKSLQNGSPSTQL